MSQNGHANAGYSKGMSGNAAEDDASRTKEGDSDEDIQTNDLKSIKGYDQVGNIGENIELAAPEQAQQQTGSAPKMVFDDVGNLDKGQCREAMLMYVSESCCYGKGCARDMEMTYIGPSTALHYTLETFSESRSTGYADAPYRGGPVDGPENGDPPPPWDIPCPPDQEFSDHKKLLEVPHTSSVRTCVSCQGSGIKKCNRCNGRGQIRCTRCGGDGKISRSRPNEGDSCHSCGGDGKKRCNPCRGEGRRTCGRCKGARQLVVYIQLIVTFKNHLSDYIMEETDMPDELIRDVQGVPVFEQKLPAVWPIVSYPVPEVNQNSSRLVEEHKAAFPNERQIQQRQILRAVPVTEVHYKWKDMSSRFWVYGKERKVYCPDYPQTCCCGCTIL